MRSAALSASFDSPSDDAAPAKLNRRQAAKVRTRQKVIEAARGLFAERGYEPATIRDIAKGAGMSTGAVFANFQDKAELFEAVLAEELGELLRAVQTGDPKTGTVSARLTSALTAGYHHSLDQLPLMQATIARSWFQPDDADKRSRAFIKPIIETLIAILQDGIRSGELRQDLELPLLGRLIWDVYISNFRFAAYDGWDIAQLETHVRKQMDMILAGHLAR